MENHELENVVATELETLGFECVKLEVIGTTRSPIVRLYIDRDGGVSIKDCAMVNRTLSLVLDRLDPFPGRYLLEVSSPGSNRPLTRQEHFVRFVGAQAKVQCVGADADKKTYTGHIRSCINGMLVMDTDLGQQVIRLADIVKANLIAQEYKIDKKHKRPKRTRGKNKGEKL